MSAIVVAHTWLFATLKASAALAAAGGWSVGDTAKVFESRAPELAAPPYVVWKFLGSETVVTINSDLTISHSNVRYAVFSIGQSRALATLAAMNAVIEPLIHGLHHAAAAGGMVIAGYKQTELLLADPDLGVEYRQLGAQYQLVVRET